jgi:hypothetical protein
LVEGAATIQALLAGAGGGCAIHLREPARRLLEDGCTVTCSGPVGPTGPTGPGAWWPRIPLSTTSTLGSGSTSSRSDHAGRKRRLRSFARSQVRNVCRWLAYSGSPIRLEELLVKRDRSLIDQSLHARQGATPTNGDGFGVGWYEDAETPRLYRSTHPAWNDRNLRELAAGTSSPLFFAHIRTSTGTALIPESSPEPARARRSSAVPTSSTLVRDSVVRADDRREYE